MKSKTKKAPPQKRTTAKPTAKPRAKRKDNTVYTLAEHQRRLTEFRKANPHAVLTPDFFANRGRSSEFKPELHCSLLYEHLATGHTITSFGAVIGYSRETVYEWLNAHPMFAEARKLGEMARIKLMEDIGINQATTGKGNYQTWAMLAFKYCDWVPPALSHIISGGERPLEFKAVDQMSPEERREEIDRLIAKREERQKARAVALTIDSVIDTSE